MWIQELGWIMEEYYFTDLPLKAGSASFLTAPQTSRPGVALPQWAGPSHIIKQENVPQVYSQAYLSGSIFSIEVPFFPNDSRLCQVDK